jgi:hypothetical protein
MQIFSLPVGSLVLISSLAAGCASEAPADKPSGAKKAAPAAVAKADQAKATQPEARGDVTVYGPGLEGADTVSIAAVMDDPKAYEGKLVRVEGLVVDACTKKGHWIDVAGDKPGLKMRFLAKGGAIAFPASTIGKRAVAEGTVRVRNLDLEESREWAEHMAKHAGKEFDPAEVTEPIVLVQLDGRSAEIRESA